jgi:hypothetical protein
MFRSRLAEATLIGCLTALASFCALNARAEETYSIVAQSNRSSAATGCRPLSERIAAANLPLITPSTDSATAVSRKTTLPTAPLPEKAVAEAENMAVAAVRVDHEIDVTDVPPPPTTLWPFAFKWPAFGATPPSASAKQPPAKKAAASGRNGHQHATARSNGKGPIRSSPESTVTR